jgi:hypothetical protein
MLDEITIIVSLIHFYLTDESKIICQAKESKQANKIFFNSSVEEDVKIA